MGPTGPQGPAGPTGPQGPQGLQGPPGEADLLARTAYSLGTISGPVSLALTNGGVQAGTLNGNVTFTLPGLASGTAEHLTLLLTNDSTAGRSVTITDIVWLGGTAPTFDTAASARNIILLRGTAAGWIGDGGKA